VALLLGGFLAFAAFEGRKIGRQLEDGDLLARGEVVEQDDGAVDELERVVMRVANVLVDLHELGNSVFLAGNGADGLLETVRDSLEYPIAAKLYGTGKGDLGARTHAYRCVGVGRRGKSARCGPAELGRDKFLAGFRRAGSMMLQAVVTHWFEPFRVS
jgi:hypothetical protein